MRISLKTPAGELVIEKKPMDRDRFENLCMIGVAVLSVLFMLGMFLILR